MVRYIYDSWGNHAVVDVNGGDITTGIGVLNPFRYRGYYYDTETGLYYLQTRYYDPELGRFISQDSIDYADPETINGLNLYAYCLNNPIMAIDPDGTIPKWLGWLISAAVLALGIGLCFVPGGQGFGAALIVGGASMLASNIMSAAGVDGKTASLISSGLDILAGIVLCFTPLAGLGASLIGAGVGGIAGGYLSEALGGSFQFGAGIGSIIGSIVAGQAFKIYDATKVSKIAKQGTVVIGETMSRVHTAANRIGAGTFRASNFANFVYKCSPTLGSAITKSENIRWIDRVIRSGVGVVDIGIDLNRVTRSKFYIMELQRIFKYKLFM